MHLEQNSYRLRMPTGEPPAGLATLATVIALASLMTCITLRLANQLLKLLALGGKTTQIDMTASDATLHFVF